MKFREVSAQQVGGLTAAALLTAGGGVKWKLRSIRRKLTSTDESVEAATQRREALSFLLKNPLIFKSFFKEDVRQVAKDLKLNYAFAVLALHDYDGFIEASDTLTPKERAHKAETLFEYFSTEDQKTKESIQNAKEALMLGSAQPAVVKPIASTRELAALTDTDE